MPVPTDRRPRNPAAYLIAAALIIAGARSLSHPPSGAGPNNRDARLLGHRTPASRPAAAHTAMDRRVAVPIEQVCLGDRVRVELPDTVDGGRFAPPGAMPASEPSLDGEEVDPSTWRRVDLTMASDGDFPLTIALLRPTWWLESNRARPGDTVRLSMPEMGADGPARVVAVGPCPTIRPGTGGVVTGLFTRDGADVVDVHLEGMGEPIGSTPTHPFYSEDRRAFVPAVTLQAGERLRPASGVRAARVKSATLRASAHRVYNLEVHRDHVYRVGPLAVLVHNQSPISMDKAIDDAVGHAQSGGPGGVMESTGKGTNFQFRNTFTNSAGQTESRIGRLDVNPADPHVQQLGPHLNLETQINGKTVRSGPLADPHTPINPATIRPGDHP